ncbi:TlpA disulfide reductase family protein [Flavobacterium sp. N1719]|uniref:TlpA disulfide reductase family protein n=1 Tax=Flavobacterium sp. N1719 TaxID=2885633 RepID=UPI0022238EAF|nr:TlpA disulfide reductase family protein [Flavobacterium sp. N1719]
MKKIFLCGLLAVLFTACGKSDSYTIEGTIDKKNDGSMAYLRYENALGVLKEVDSAKITEGTFSFKGKVETLDLFSITVEDINTSINFVMEPGDITVHIATDPKDYPKVGGTPYNDQLQKLNETYKKFDDDLFAFQTKNMDIYKKAVAAKDTTVINQLMEKATALNKKKFEFLNSYPVKNPDHFMSVMLLQQRVYNGDTSFVEINNTFKKMPVALRECRIGKELEQRLKAIENARKVKAQGGTVPAPSAPQASKQAAKKKAPEFQGKSPEGKVVTLQSALGKITLLDFWASWCPPCRKENPNVVKLYADYHAKGFNILGVSLDEDVAKWKAAIAKDKITWPQVSNLKGWHDPIAKLYGIEEIPTTFLLDAEGNIIARGLTGEALRAKVSSLLP